MTLIQWLRKLGILRYGTCSGTYRNGKDRPTELLMDDVYDAKKDLVHRSDFKPGAPGEAGKTEKPT